MLDPYVLLTFQGIQEKRKIPRSCWRCWILTSSLLLKETMKKEKKQELHEVWILTSSLLLKEFKKKEKFPGAAGGAGPLRPPYF